MTSVVPDIDREEESSPTTPFIDNESLEKNTFNYELLQVINEKKEFSGDLLRYMKEWNIANKGFDYHVIAVIGSQSTGKSTLLNKLFNTQFDMMKETQRQQTTKGIWLSNAKQSSVLVLDVEGSDGRERGEDQDFERKSALFSLATTEVLLINMWETQVGLYNGANMGLLKTVFDVNLELFQSAGSPKTLLLFVIRDFTGITPLDNLSKTLLADLNKIWDSLKKPSTVSSISSCFDFKFIGLPHKHFAAAQFDQSVSVLRTWFFDPSNADYVFKKEYHKHIPADGFPKFAESIWDKIGKNKDLDLPSQQILLAQFRCDEIMKVAFGGFLESVKPFQSRLESGVVVQSFGKDVEEMTKLTLQNFDMDAQRYHAEVYQSKREELLGLMRTNLKVAYLQQLRNLHKSGVAEFQRAMDTAGDSDFAVTVKKSKAEALYYFKNGAESERQGAILKGADWVFDDYYKHYSEEIDNLHAKKRSEVMERVYKNLLKSVAEELSEPVELQISEADEKMWDRIIEKFAEQLDAGYFYEGFGATSAELVTTLKEFRKQAWEDLNKKLRDELGEDRVLSRLRNRFNESFRYDENGIPRVWRPGDDLDTYFIKAKEEAHKLLYQYAKIDVPIARLIDLVEPEGENVGGDPLTMLSNGGGDNVVTASSLVILSGAKISNVREMFKKECDGQFLDAKRSTVAVTAKVPLWIYGLMAVLGWNEVYYMLSNPMFFMFSLFVGIGFGVLWYTKMLGVFWMATKSAMNSVRMQLQEQAVTYLAQTEETTANRNSTSTYSESKMGESIMMKAKVLRGEEEIKNNAKKSD
ncbi:Dynamin-like GTPase that mediates homotypic ER fusion [Nowakowskiella sp. JEL0407]|nr:Dynamin-like GTPase that mediates homotypic ER fusion [Nowakowskiella sp. JEL0407]